MSTDRRIKGLKTRQKSLLSSFNLIKTFVDTYDEETGACEIPVRLESLNTIWSDFKQVQSELESLDEATIDQQLKQRADFETAYYRVKGFLLSNNKTPSSPRMNTSSNSSSQFPVSPSHVRLPDVKLPVFSGNLDDWLNFHDLFVSLVHSSQELSNIQKFYYLRSSLAGDALKLVQTIQLSANNYAVAWNLLVDHFQNTARLKQSYLDTLFEFPTLKRESAADLHSLVEKFEANVKVLKQLGEKTEYWDIILIRMLSIRLDTTTRRDWEEHSSTKDAITFQDLTSFLQRRVTVLQTIQGKPVEAPASTQQFRRPAQRPIASHGASQINVGRKCVFCSDHHPLYLCSSFSKLDVETKESEVRRHHLCRNCLRTGHQVRDCSSPSSCRKCRGRHHTLLCSGENSVAANSRTTESSQSEAPTTSTSGEQPKASVSATVREPNSYASTRQAQHNVLLATAVVKLVDDSGTAHLARALLDSGSECCFITESFSQRVKAQRKTISIPISGIGQSSSHARCKIVSTIRSRVSDYSTLAEFLVLPKVTIDLPTASFDTSSWQIPSGVLLADPSFHEAKQIDIVIGAEIFFELFKVPGRIPLGDSLPILVNSVLGWIVSGKVSHGTPTKPVVSNVALLADQPRFTEHLCTTEEDATPSCSIEQASSVEHFQRILNTVEQHSVRSLLKDADCSDALVEAECWLSTFYLASRNPSFIDLHVDNLSSLDRILLTPTTTAHVTTEEKNSTEAIIFQLARQRTIAKKWKQRALTRPVRPLIHAFFTACVRSCNVKHLYRLYITIRFLRYWFTGARILARSAECISVAFVNTRQKPAPYDTATQWVSEIDVKHWRFISLHYSCHRTTSWNAYTSCVLWITTDTVNIELIVRLHTSICLQTPHRFHFPRELLSNDRRDFMKDANELPELLRFKNLQPATTWKELGKVVIRADQMHFIRVLGNRILPQDNVKMRVMQFDPCLNHCPTVRLYDLLESQPSTPGRFLMDSSLKAIPNTDVIENQRLFLLAWKRRHAEWCDPPISSNDPRSKSSRLLLLTSSHGLWPYTHSSVITFVQLAYLLLSPPTQDINNLCTTDQQRSRRRQGLQHEIIRRLIVNKHQHCGIVVSSGKGINLGVNSRMMKLFQFCESEMKLMQGPY